VNFRRHFLIPSLEHDDANRALHGLQHAAPAVPLLRPGASPLWNGLETPVARDSGMVADQKGERTVTFVDADGHRDQRCGKAPTTIHHCRSIQRSNQDTCLNQRPIVARVMR